MGESKGPGHPGTGRTRAGARSRTLRPRRSKFAERELRRGWTRPTAPAFAIRELQVAWRRPPRPEFASGELRGAWPFAHGKCDLEVAFAVRAFHEVVARSRTSSPRTRSRPSRGPDASRNRSLPAEVADWRTDRRVARVTAEIRSLHASAEKLVADTVVEIGARLEAIREHLPHGQWLEWVDQALPVVPRVAQRWIQIARWARSEPAEFRRLRHLGPTKLRVIVPLPPERRRALDPSKPMIIHGVRKTIEVMSEDELRDLFGLRAEEPRTREDIDDVVKRLRHDTAGLGAVVDLLIARKSEVPKSVARKLRAEIDEVRDKLDDAFDL